MQQKISLRLLIDIPESQVLIERLELESLKEADLLGIYWSMLDLENRMGRKKDWIKQNVLYNQRFKSTLDIKCGGFVYYPQKKGEPWSMHALKMAKFLDENFNQIFGD
ncbi:DUF771 domain-containing protein [Lysinibacillus fusiformis]|uniref:DUF771 domain-containing protein n=1 Tax=Lysinibacillus fusiformis TaxID=28031 RepID=UPI003556F400